MKKFEAPELNILLLVTEDVTSTFVDFLFSAVAGVNDIDSEGGWSADE